MPATSNILPNRDEDSEDAEREIMMPAAEVIDGVIGEEWFVDVILGSARQRMPQGIPIPLITMPTDDEEAAYSWAGMIMDQGWISVDNYIYPLHRISHFHVRSEAIKIRTIES